MAQINSTTIQNCGHNKSMPRSKDGLQVYFSSTVVHADLSQPKYIKAFWANPNLYYSHNDDPVEYTWTVSTMALQARETQERVRTTGSFRVCTWAFDDLRLRYPKLSHQEESPKEVRFLWALIGLPFSIFSLRLVIMNGLLTSLLSNS